MDILRGFAVLGILLINHNHTHLHIEAWYPSLLSQVGHGLLETLGRSKFWPLFAMLFGIGMAIQFDRAETRSAKIVLPYLRRLASLFLLGCLLTLVLHVQQLIFLAVAGVSAFFMGYLLRGYRPYWLLVASLGFFLLSLSFSIPREIAWNQGTSGPPQVSVEEVAARIQDFRTEAEREGGERALAWSHGTLRPQVEGRFRWTLTLPGYLVQTRGFANLVVFFLVGIFLWRIGVVNEPEKHLKCLRRTLLFAIPIGLGAALYSYSSARASTLTTFGLGAFPTPLMRLLNYPAWILAGLGMSITYFVGFSLLLRRERWVRVLSPLAPVGRMALTNYVLQALLPALLFGYFTPGIPLWSLNVPLLFLALLGLFGLQVILSRAWLRTYRFGPLEWLLRSLTYGRLQPMRRPLVEV